MTDALASPDEGHIIFGHFWGQPADDESFLMLGKSLCHNRACEVVDAIKHRINRPIKRHERAIPSFRVTERRSCPTHGDEWLLTPDETWAETFRDIYVRDNAEFHYCVRVKSEWSQGLVLDQTLTLHTQYVWDFRTNFIAVISKW